MLVSNFWCSSAILGKVAMTTPDYTETVMKITTLLGALYKGGDINSTLIQQWQHTYVKWAPAVQQQWYINCKRAPLVKQQYQMGTNGTAMEVNQGTISTAVH